MAYKHIEDRRLYHRKYMKERRAFFRAHRLCTECGKEDAYTMAGHPRCFKHTHYRQRAPIEYIPVPRAKKETVIYPEGSCYRCGRPVKEGVTKWGGELFRVCESCYQDNVRAAEKGRKRQEELMGFPWGRTPFSR